MSRTARPPRPRLGVGAMTLGPAPLRFTLAIVESDDDDVLRPDQRLVEDGLRRVWF